MKYAFNDVTYAVGLYTHMIMALAIDRIDLAAITGVMVVMGVVPYAITDKCWIVVFRRSIERRINLFVVYRWPTRVLVYIMLGYWVLCLPLLLFFI